MCREKAELELELKTRNTTIEPGEDYLMEAVSVSVSMSMRSVKRERKARKLCCAAALVEWMAETGVSNC
jgi:hypothetical protein